MKNTISILNLAVALVLASGCATNQTQKKSEQVQLMSPSGCIDPTDTNCWCDSCTNQEPPIPWNGVTTFTVNTPTNNTILTTTNGPTDTNHFYAIYEASDAAGPWTFKTNVIGGFPVTFTDTNNPAMFKAQQLPGIVVWSTSTFNVTDLSGGCPRPYIGYSLYQKPPTNSDGSPLWGWFPSHTNNPLSITDLTRTNTKLQFFSAYGQVGCGASPLLFTNGYTATNLPVPPFQFAVYFTNNVQTNYPLLLTGFNP
jgi:hypothetical protein